MGCSRRHLPLCEGSSCDLLLGIVLTNSVWKRSMWLPSGTSVIFYIRISADIKKWPIYYRQCCLYPGMFIPDRTTLLMSMKDLKGSRSFHSGKGLCDEVSTIVGLVASSDPNTGPWRSRRVEGRSDENLRKYLLENEIASAEELDQIQEEVKEAVEASVKFAEESPFPPLRTQLKIFTQTMGSRELRKLN